MEQTQNESPEIGWFSATRYLFLPSKLGRVLFVGDCSKLDKAFLERTCDEVWMLNSVALHEWEEQGGQTGDCVCQLIACRCTADRRPYGNLVEGYFDCLVVGDLGTDWGRSYRTRHRRLPIGIEFLGERLGRFLDDSGVCVIVMRNRFGYDRLLSALRRPRGGLSFVGLFGRGSLLNPKVFLDQARISCFSRFPVISDERGISEVVVTGDYSPPKNSVQWKERWKGALMRSPYAASVAPLTAIVGSRTLSKDSFLEQLLATLQGSSSMNGAIGKGARVQRYLVVPGKVIVSIRCEGANAGWVCVLPFTPEATKRMYREAANLEGLSNQVSSIDRLVPRFAGHGVFEGQPFFVEQEMPGITIDSTNRLLDHATSQAVEILTAFHHETAKPVLLTEDLLDTLVRNPVHTAARKADRELDVLQRLQTLIAERLKGRVWKTVWMHGDYKIENVTLDPVSGRVTGVIDWDLAQQTGLPYLDLIYLILYNRVIREGSQVEDAFLDVLFARRFNEREVALITQYLKELDIDQESERLLLAIFWIYHLAFRIELVGRSQLSREKIFLAFELIEKLLTSTQT